VSTSTPESGLTFSVGPFPASLSETPEDRALLVTQWRKQASEKGFVTIGEPEFVAHRMPAEDTIVGDDQENALEQLFADLGAQVSVVGQVRTFDGPLPTFVPSRESVEAAAEVLYNRAASGPDWAALAAHQRNYYTNIAASILSRTGHRLVTDSLNWVAEHQPTVAPELEVDAVRQVSGRLWQRTAL
jgi:hypothetical protein